MKYKEVKYYFLSALMLLVLSSILFTGGAADAKERRYATEDEALEEAFPGSSFRKEVIVLDSFLKSKITENLGKNVYESSVDTYEARLDGKVQGYGFVMNQIGKTKDITFLVSMNPEGEVVFVSILVFRESQGFEVKNKRWLAQFKGKDLLSRLRVKKDIDNISGATMSARAVTKGVARALAFFHGLKDNFGTQYFK